jgi:hypothetical protein
MGYVCDMIPHENYTILWLNKESLFDSWQWEDLKLQTVLSVQHSGVDGERRSGDSRQENMCH